MMTVTESTANATSQSIGKFNKELNIKKTNSILLDYNNYVVNRSYMTTTYDNRHHNPWEKPNLNTFHYPSPLFPTYSTGGTDITNTDPIPNLNNTNPNFYRRHSMLMKKYLT
jgi:hypothetical protein